MTFKNLEDILTKGPLQERDMVIFNVNGEIIKYRVSSDRLISVNGIINNLIFNRLNIGNRQDFASDSYGYRTVSKPFPPYKKNDFKAAERIVKDLFKRADRLNGEHIEGGQKVYRSRKDLLGNILREGDFLYFKIKGETLKYKVNVTHLNSIKIGVPSFSIFLRLGIESPDRKDFASKIYGYESKGGSFPSYKTDDYKSATNIALVLFKKIENLSSEPLHPGLPIYFAIKSDKDHPRWREFIEWLNSKTSRVNVSGTINGGYYGNIWVNSHTTKIFRHRHNSVNSQNKIISVDDWYNITQPTSRVSFTVDDTSTYKPKNNKGTNEHIKEYEGKVLNLCRATPAIERGSRRKAETIRDRGRSEISCARYPRYEASPIRG